MVTRGDDDAIFQVAGLDDALEGRLNLAQDWRGNYENGLLAVGRSTLER